MKMLIYHEPTVICAECGHRLTPWDESQRMLFEGVMQFWHNTNQSCSQQELVIEVKLGKPTHAEIIGKMDWSRLPAKLVSVKE